MRETTRERLTYLGLCLGTFITGLGILVYHGPAQRLIRGSMGDVLAVIFLYAFLSVSLLGTWRQRLLFTLGFAFALELIQLLQILPPDAPRALRVILGATFDIWDLAAYTLGAIPIAAWEYWRHHKTSPAEPSSPAPEELLP